MKLAVISVSRQGDVLAENFHRSLDAKVYSKSNTDKFDIKAITEELMENCDGIIFIASTGIAVRAIAPYLKGKTEDPAVVVVDCTGKFVISLLSGHLGGANELTLKLSELIGAQPVITTASDNLGFDAPDMIAKSYGLVIEDLKKAKEVAALMVAGESVAFKDEEGIISLPKGYTENFQNAEALIYVSDKLQGGENIKTLRLIRRDLILGIGCRKDYEPMKMRKIVLDLLTKHNYDYRAVSTVSTVEVKRNEKAVLELAEFLDSELIIHAAEEIKKIQGRYEGSDFVERTIGVRAVCEPCVELSGAEMLTGKISREGMTICIGRRKGKL